MAMSKQEKSAAVVMAMAHPLRRQILQRLSSDVNGGMSAKMLANDLGQPLGNVSYHMRCLAKVGVLKLANEKRRRGAIETFYKRAGNAVDKKTTEVLELID